MKITMDHFSLGKKEWVAVVLAMVIGLVGTSGLVKAKALDEQFMMLMGARNAVKAEKYETAIDRYQKLLKMSGSHVKARSEMGWVLMKAGKYQAGQREFETVLKAEPNNVNALRGRLEGVRKAKDQKAEYEVLTQLVRLSPKDRELRKQLALALHNQGKYQEAETHLAILMGEN